MATWQELQQDAFDHFLSGSIAEDENGCWLWQGELDKDGYGLFLHKDKRFWMHRVSFQLMKGPIPPRHHVCHSCDVRDCVNPDHLWTGTATENMRDCIAKGRMPRGKRQERAV
jgi:hypothetical protein